MNAAGRPLVGIPSHVIWDLMLARRWLILGITLAFTLAAVAAAFLLRPVYRVSAVLIPAESADSSAGLSAMFEDVAGLAALAGLNLEESDQTTEAIAILRSRQFTEEFIRDENLLPRLFSEKWDSDRNEWSVSPSRTPSLYDGFRKFDRSVRRVTEDNRSGLVRLDIDWRDAQEGARWANELVRRLNERMRARVIAESEATVQFLEQEFLGTTIVSVQQSISRAIESHVKRRTVAATRPEYAFRIVDPAAAPDPDDFVRPQRALYIAAGPVVGLLFAISVVLVWDLFGMRRLRAASSTST